MRLCAPIGDLLLLSARSFYSPALRMPTTHLHPVRLRSEVPPASRLKYFRRSWSPLHVGVKRSLRFQSVSWRSTKPRSALRASRVSAMLPTMCPASSLILLLDSDRTQTRTYRSAESTLISEPRQQVSTSTTCPFRLEYSPFLTGETRTRCCSTWSASRSSAVRRAL